MYCTCSNCEYGVSVDRFLLKRLRTATLRSDFEGQAVLINCLMRNYLHYSLFKQAAKLVSKVRITL